MKAQIAVQPFGNTVYQCATNELLCFGERVLLGSYLVFPFESLDGLLVRETLHYRDKTGDFYQLPALIHT